MFHIPTIQAATRLSPQPR